MKTLKYLFLGLTGFLFAGISLFAQNDLSGIEIMRKSRNVSKFAGLEAVTQLRIVDARGRERIRKITMASRVEGSVEKRIIKFLDPPDVRGTGMLVFDYEDKNDELWLYLPALRKVRKIVSTEKGKNFMGSEFSNADMTAPNIGDFKINKLGEEKIANTDCYKVEMIPVNGALAREYGYAKKIAWIGVKDFVMRKAIYYDEEGEVHKILTAGDIVLLDQVHEKYIAKEMTMINKENGRKSYLKMLRVQYNPKVNPAYFTMAYLQK